MSLVSYKQLIYLVEDFARQHLQIQKFKAEFEEQLPNFATTDEAYPILFMSPVGSVYSNLNQFNVRFYVFDIIQKDRANINTILSDTSLILNDLKLWFTDGDNYNLELIGDPIARPLNNYLMDYAAGWTMDVTFRVGNYCVEAIPFETSPLVDINGCDVTYSRYLTCETVTGCTSFQNYIDSLVTGITFNDIYVTGGTYDNNSGVATFTNTTGGTFNVSGFSTGGTGGTGTTSSNIIQSVIVGRNLAVLGDVIYNIPITFSGEIVKYSIYAQQPPTGSASVVGLKKNGTLITTTGVSVNSGNNFSSNNPVFSSNVVSPGDVLTPTFTAIGSTNSGRQYSIIMEFLI